MCSDRLPPASRQRDQSPNSDGAASACDREFPKLPIPVRLLRYIRGNSNSPILQVELGVKESKEFGTIVHGCCVRRNENGGVRNSGKKGFCLQSGTLSRKAKGPRQSFPAPWKPEEMTPLPKEGIKNEPLLPPNFMATFKFEPHGTICHSRLVSTPTVSPGARCVPPHRPLSRPANATEPGIFL